MTEIFHITHLANLPHVIGQGGLWSDADRMRLNLNVTNIGYGHIKQRRLGKPLPAGVARGGTVGEYVPFYVAPRSPMLYAIGRGTVEGYTEGQRPIVHLVAHAEAFGTAESAVTDGNASDALTSFFTGHHALRSEIDWPLMSERYWNDTDDDGDRKRRRQAEFLVHKFVNWTSIHLIGVMDSDIEKQVRAFLKDKAHKPAVAVRGEWYY